MARAKRKAVEGLVSRLLSETDQTEPPVDVERIARDVGAEVRVEALEADLSGLVHRGASGAVIGINKSHPPTRRRFTLAHELGHLLLGHGETVVDKSPLKRDSVASLAISPREIEANRFAAELLMPQSWVLEAVGDRELTPLDEAFIEQTAQTFKVSPQAMTYRLTNLGFLKA